LITSFDSYSATEEIFSSVEPATKKVKTEELLITAATRRTTRNYLCQYEGCNKACSSNSNLIVHMRTHTGERPYQCPREGCNKAYIQSSDLTKHIQYQHPGEKPYVCTVDGCDKAYSFATGLAEHVRVVHNGGKPLRKKGYYPCTDCEKVFEDKGSLNRH